MVESWRIVDTGLRPAAQNLALNRALLEARSAEEIPSTLRFLRFTPCALIGCSQSPAQELNLGVCRAAGIEIQRRLTGGDVMVLNENQLVWELYLHRRDIGRADLRAMLRRLCHAAAAAVSALGLDARYRPQSDIEVDGRSVSCSAGIFDADALLFQGSLSIDLDPGLLARASRLAGAAPGPVRERFTNLELELGSRPDMALIRRCLAEAYESEFGIEFGEGDLTLSEHARFRTALRELDHPDWINLVTRPADELPLLQGQRQVAGGRLQAAVAYDRQTDTIRRAWFASETPVTPRRSLSDLEAVLCRLPAGRVAQCVERFFAGRQGVMPPFMPADFIEVLQLAIGQLLPAGTNGKNDR